MVSRLTGLGLGVHLGLEERARSEACGTDAHLTSPERDRATGGVDVAKDHRQVA
jgi:hypothetical protein